MTKWIHRIGIGSIAWWIVDVVLPFIPFGGVALTLGLAYVGFLILRKTLFKDSNSNSSSFGSATDNINTDTTVRQTMERADRIEM